MSEGPASVPRPSIAPPGEATPRRRTLLALLALAAYAALASFELRHVLTRATVLSPAAFVARGGPFSEPFKRLAPPGIDLLADTARQFTPWLRYAADHLQEDGELPLWKTTAFCGAPLVGNGQSALFHPARLLSVLLGAPSWVHAAMAWMRLVIAAFGGYLLLRHLRASPLGAFVGGLAFGFGGFLIVFRFHPHADVVALLPWLVLAADWLVQAPSARGIAFVGLLAGVQWLAGHPQTAMHAQGCVTLVALARAFSARREPGGPGLLRPLLALGAGLLLGLAVAAIQLLPLAEYAALSESAELRKLASARLQFLDEPWLSLAFVLALVAAGLALAWLARGRRVLPAAALLLVATAGALLAGLRCGLTEIVVLPLCADWFGPPNHFMGPLNYVEGNGAFVGAALPLCAAGLLFGRPRGVVRVAGLAAALGVLAGLRAPVLMDLLRLLPLVGLADNGRLVLVGLLGLAVLAGLGVDGLRHAAARPAARARLAAALLAPELALFGVLVWSVERGDIVSLDKPGTTRAPLDLARFGLLPASAELEAWIRELEKGDPLAMRLPDPPVDADHLQVLGWFAVREPPISAQLVYGTQCAMAITRPTRLPDDVALPGASGDGPQPLPHNWIVYVFRSSFPRDDVPPEVPLLAVHVAVPSGILKSALLRAYEPTRDEPLLFPARPAPAPADGAWQLWLLGLAALLAVIGCGARAAWLAGATSAGLAALVAASLLPFGEALAPALPRDFFYPVSGGYDLPRREWPEHRVLSMDVYALGAEVPTAYGIPDARGYDALTPPRIAMLLRAALDWPDRLTSMEMLPARNDPDLPLLGLMSVRLLLDWELSTPGLRRIAWAGERKLRQPFPIIENPWALPRARLVGRATLQADDARALALLRAPAFDRQDAAVLADATGVPGELLVAEAEVLTSAGEPEPPLGEHPDVAGPVSAAGSAHIAADSPDRVEVAIEPSGPALLLLADTDFPGWRAFVDGVERPIVRANVAFRAVPVAPGEKRVEFRYEPRSFAVGRAVTLASLGVLLLLVTPLRRKRESGREP